MPIFDHLGIKVANFNKSKAFYQAAFETLGITLLMEFDKMAGFGRNGKPDFWIGEGATDFMSAEQAKVNTPIHIAFVAKGRKAVDAFYKAAISAGALDHGKPGLRPEYHPHYYGAFVLDFDGNNIEAVCHDPS